MAHACLLLHLNGDYISACSATAHTATSASHARRTTRGRLRRPSPGRSASGRLLQAPSVASVPQVLDTPCSSLTYMKNIFAVFVERRISLLYLSKVHCVLTSQAQASFAKDPKLAWNSALCGALLCCLQM